jgi:ABC-type multidrug transport system fused ATPase/permease subunit
MSLKPFRAKVGVKPTEEQSFFQRWGYLPRLGKLQWQISGPKPLLVIGVMALGGTLLPLLVLEFMRRLVDSTTALLTGQGDLGYVLLLLAGLVLTDYVEFAFYLALKDYVQTTLEKFMAGAQEQMLQKAAHLSLAAFEQPAFYDQLQRAQKGLDTKILATTQKIFTVPFHLLRVGLLLVYVGAGSLIFPLILVSGLVPWAFYKIHGLRQTEIVERGQTQRERELTYLGDLMVERKAAAELRLFGLQNYLLTRHLRLFHELRDERLKLATQQLKGNLLSGLFQQFTYIAVVIAVVLQVAQGQLSVGYFASYLAAAETFRYAILFLFMDAATLDHHLRYIGDLLDYLELEEEDQQLGHLKLLLKEGPVIAFEKVCFAYPGSDHYVLEDINLTIRAGERVALVGENGAGKSTFARLLLGLYRPTSGRITLNGVDLSSIDPGWWRSYAAAVFQEYFRYELTARENIGFGNLSQLWEDLALAKAAEQSGANEVIATLPKGYESYLGRGFEESGQDLSSGQWQKLAMARAYLREALVLVLDEPTAALDARAEVEVYRQFGEMAQGKSVLFISHRLGSARLADRIVVIKEGRITESGTHAELMARKGLYATLFSTQANWYQ